MIPIICYDCRVALESKQNQARIGVVPDGETQPTSIWEAAALECPGCGVIIFIKTDPKPWMSKGDKGWEVAVVDTMDSDWYLLEFTTWIQGLPLVFGGLKLMAGQWLKKGLSAAKVSVTKQQRSHMTLYIGRGIRSLFAKIRKEREEIDELISRLDDLKSS